jgi:DNA modification methylase
MTSPPYYGLRDYGEDEQIGLEDSLDRYIQELVAVADALKDVLRDDGSWWLNLGDSYENKQKQLVPHKVAIALQDTGWVVRNDCTWIKPNPMPSSVKDRLNTCTEQIFHLTPNSDYYYDLDSIREPYTKSSHDRYEYGYDAADDYPSVGGIDDDTSGNTVGKNPGDVFEITTKPFPDAHFAIYPPELCQKPIKATCPKRVCADCGEPYIRDVDRETTYDHNTTEATSNNDRNDLNSGDGHDLRNGVYSDITHKGWIQECDCSIDETHGGIALDPFAGAGTTCMVAKDLQRRFVGIDLNPEYVAMAQKRLGLTVDNPTHIRDDEKQQGIESFTN